MQQVQLISECCVFHDHDFSVSGKNFLWVELHGNDMARNTQASESYAGTLHECHILQNSVSMKIHGIRNIQTQRKFTV